MCIIIYKPKGKSVPLERLFNAKERNPHGFGLSYAVNKKLQIYKTMDFDDFLEKYAKVNHHDCLIHFRFATKGKKEKINCHPFRINKNLVMAHNGTIQNLEGTSDEKSDSRTFAHSYIRPMVQIKKDFIKSKNGKRWMKGMISMQTNKLVFMNHHGTPTFINGDLGHWSQGCWYSNETYKKRSIGTYKKSKSPLYPKTYKTLASKNFRVRRRATAHEILNELPSQTIRANEGIVNALEKEIGDQVDLWDDIQDIDQSSDLDSNPF